MRRASAGLANDAQRLVDDPADIDAHVDLVVQDAAFAANAAVFGRVSRTVGTLLDVLA
jgi:hypothetical protein